MSNEIRNKFFLSDLEDLVRFALESDVDIDTIRWGLDNYGLDLELWKQEIMEEKAVLMGERQAAAEAEPIKDYADKHGE